MKPMIAVFLARRAARAAIRVAFLFGGVGIASAANIPVPNGDFTATTNFGTVGGGLVGATGTDVPIGSGPWTGSYHGILGLLAPPQLTISSGSAAITGIAGIDVLGILDNGGSFGQTLPASFETGKRYTLSAHVDTGSVLDLGVLGSANVGFALQSATTTLASTATAPPSLLSIQPLGGTAYQVSLVFDATDTVSGAIGVQLFAAPQALIGASLITNLQYTLVTLDGTAIDPISGSILGVLGTLQSATVGTAFPDALGVMVVDVDGDPVPNVAVTFQAPSSGASATLATTTVDTDANGLASVQATANTIAGSYTINASVAGVDVPASFALTNLAGLPASVVSIGAGVDQATDILTPFADPLVVAVADAFGNAIGGVSVDFAAPAAGASASLSAASAITDPTGLAQVEATANGVPGDYEVTVSVDGVPITAAFSLTNQLPGGTTFDGGGPGSQQSADLEGAFLCQLEVHVAQADGTPYAGMLVQFDAPASGASATLSDGVNSGPSVMTMTDADGAADVQAVANNIGGSYVVSATLVGTDLDPIGFPLSNIESLIYASGFDLPCTPSP